MILENMQFDSGGYIDVAPTIFLIFNLFPQCNVRFVCREFYKRTFGYGGFIV